MTAIAALILKLLGVSFLFIAAIGLIRFTDAFQRMHAATKAGTLGAGLVVAGTMVSHGSTDSIIMGTLTILFLLLTVPVAGHMLGRASYISGAPMQGLRGANALDGILERQTLSLEERLSGGTLPDPIARILGQDEPQDTLDTSREWWPDLKDVKFAVIDDHVAPVFSRALGIARSNRAHISAHVIIDQAAIDCARDMAEARTNIRERASRAMAELEALKGQKRVKLGLHYDEGNPESILSSRDGATSLLVLPRTGWFHHGSDDRRPGTSWEPDGLLRLPAVHSGPVLYSDGKAQRSGFIVVNDSGEPDVLAGLDWALRHSVWGRPKVVVFGDTAPKRFAAFDAIAIEHEVTCEMAPSLSWDAETSTLPPQLSDADGIVLASLPRPLRTYWYGHAWHDRLMAGYGGDIFIVGAR